jgi:DNA polymerase-3 subunit gamma/tau
MLSTSAFNALLKTLEEPPPHVVFMMATTEAQKIPNTILSRCQRYDFRKISTKLIADHLSKICSAERIKADSEALWAIARQGDGSMRDAQSLLDQVISFAGNGLTRTKVVDVLGLTDRALLNRTLSALVAAASPEAATQEIVGCIESVFLAGYDPVIFMKDLLEELRNLLLAKVGSDRASDMLDLPADEVTRLRELGQKLREEDIHLLFDMALKGATDLARAQDTRVVLEMILLRMSIAPKFDKIENWLNAGAASAPATSAVDSVPAAKAAPATFAKATTASAAPSSDTLAEKWADFADRVRKVNGLIAAQIDQLQLVSLVGQEVTIGVSEKHQFLQQQVSDPAFLKKIVNYLNTFWGTGHTVKVQAADTKKPGNLSPVNLQEKKRQDEREALVRKVEEHPLVREAKTIFNSQIKSIRESE